MVLLSAGTILTACSSNNSSNAILQETTVDGATVTEINIDAIPSETEEIGLSEFFADLEVIRLESSEEALVMNTTIDFTDDFFLLGTQTSQAARLLRFDYEGNYLNTIGAEGGGPGEHRGQMITTLKYYQADNTVLVDWGGLERSQLFQPDGTHLQDIEIPVQLLGNINRWDEDEWFSYGNSTGRPLHPSDSVKMVFYATDGTITKQIDRSNYPPDNTTDYTPSGQPSLFTFQGTPKIYFPGDHTIYRIENKELIPDAVIQPGENILPFNELTSPDNIVGSYDLEILSETERNWFIKKRIYTEADFKEFENRPGQWGGRFDTREELIVIDKQTNKGRTYTFTDDMLQMFPEQLSENIPPWEEGVGAYAALSPDIYLKMKKASENSDQISPEVTQELEKLEGITMDDNYIIFKFNFKDEIVIE